MRVTCICGAWADIKPTGRNRYATTFQPRWEAVCPRLKDKLAKTGSLKAADKDCQRFDDLISSKCEQTYSR